MSFVRKSPEQMRSEMKVYNDPKVRSHIAEMNALNQDGLRPPSQSSSLAMEMKEQAEAADEMAITVAAVQGFPDLHDSKPEEQKQRFQILKLEASDRIETDTITKPLALSFFNNFSTPVVIHKLMPFIEDDFKALAGLTRSCKAFNRLFAPQIVNSLMKEIGKLDLDNLVIDCCIYCRKNGPCRCDHRSQAYFRRARLKSMPKNHWPFTLKRFFSGVYDVDDTRVQKEVEIWEQLMGKDPLSIASPYWLSACRIFREEDQESDNPTTSILMLGSYKRSDYLDYLNARGTYSCIEIVEMVISAAKAIEFLHKQNITHGDIRPRNFILEKDPHGKKFLKLVEIGWASQVNKPLEAWSHTESVSTFTAPEFRSELRKGNYSPKLDIYSFGMTLFLMMGGFRTNSTYYVDLYYHIQKLDHPWYQQNYPGLASLIQHMIHPDSQQRPDITQVIVRLEEIHQHLLESLKRQAESPPAVSESLPKSETDERDVCCLVM